MNERISVDRKFHVDHCGQKRMRRGDAQPTPQSGRVPRVAKLMALAIRLDRLTPDGVVADQAELACLGYVSPARLSQVMARVQLAPDIQEAILFLPPAERGRDSVTGISSVDAGCSSTAYRASAKLSTASDLRFGK